jgi:ABC-type bacteriocin/lantibiotic exporter with double-glycine peptidase domain
VRYDEDQDRPEINRALLRRVLNYGLAYKKEMVVVLVTIVIISLLSLLPPLLIGDLIDNAIPNEDLRRVTLLGVGMVLVPLLNGVSAFCSDGLRLPSAKGSSSTCAASSLHICSECRLASLPRPVPGS